MMQETMRLTKSLSNHNQRCSDFVDDECSTDSGCSSGGSNGGSAGSAEQLSRSRNCDRDSLTSHVHSGCYLYQIHKHHHNKSTTTQSQERLSRSKVSGSERRRTNKTSRSWSPRESRCDMKQSRSYSSSPSNAHSTNSDSSKKTLKTEILRRALQCLKLGKWENSGGKEKKLTKKSPKRILREPISYTYVRGLSGLPTQRIPRIAIRRLGVPCSCQNTIDLYRENPDRR